MEEVRRRSMPTKYEVGGVGQKSTWVVPAAEEIHTDKHACTINRAYMHSARREAKPRATPQASAPTPADWDFSR